MNEYIVTFMGEFAFVPIRVKAADMLGALREANQRNPEGRKIVRIEESIKIGKASIFVAAGRLYGRRTDNEAVVQLDVDLGAYSFE